MRHEEHQDKYRLEGDRNLEQDEKGETLEVSNTAVRNYGKRRGGKKRQKPKLRRSS